MAKTKRSATDWEATSLHRERDGFYLFVAKATNGPRWRYTVTTLEYVQRGPRPATLAPAHAVQFAAARGYMRSRERAMKAAEAACDGLLRAVAAAKKGHLVASKSASDL